MGLNLLQGAWMIEEAESQRGRSRDLKSPYHIRSNLAIAFKSSSAFRFVLA